MSKELYTEEEHNAAVSKATIVCQKANRKFKLKECAVNNNGLNENIKVNSMDEDLLLAAGFFKNENSNEYVLNKIIVDDPYSNINLLIFIPFENPAGLKIDVLDWGYGQPYDYQRILDGVSFNSLIEGQNSYALIVWSKVDDIMTTLVEKGILKGYRTGDYV